MPERSNRFQRLVLQLQHQLAAKGALVTESKILEDRISGDKAEVDVAVEFRANGLNLTLGFEVRNTGRKIDRNGAIAIVGKYKTLVDKAVIVSRSGFTKTAKNHCKIHGVDAITFSDAATANWGAFFDHYKELLVATFAYHVTNWPHFHCTYLGEPMRALADAPPPTVLNHQGRRFTPELWAASLIRDPQLLLKVEAEWYSHPPAQRPARYDRPVALLIDAATPAYLEQDGFQYRIDKVAMTLSVSTSETKAAMSAMQFVDRRVMQGAASIPDGEMQLVFSEGPDGIPRGTAIVSGADPNIAPVVRELHMAPRTQR
jgi:hypothetical protein